RRAGHHYLPHLLLPRVARLAGGSRPVADPASRHGPSLVPGAASRTTPTTPRPAGRGDGRNRSLTGPAGSDKMLLAPGNGTARKRRSGNLNNWIVVSSQRSGGSSIRRSGFGRTPGAGSQVRVTQEPSGAGQKQPDRSPQQS